MFATTQDEYRQKLEFARERCSESSDIGIYNRFVAGAEKYCISQTPMCFHGVSISTSYGEKVNDFVKTYLPDEKPFKVVITRVVLPLFS